jgi:hypothetical protein
MTPLEDLSAFHLDMLRAGSGIAPSVILARGYRTITKSTDLVELGFAYRQCRVPGLLIPLHSTDGGTPLYVYRPDVARSEDDKRKRRFPDGTYPQRVIKYELPAKSGVRVDCPPACRPMLGDPRIPLWITEGQKKADSLASHGLCAIDLLGVWNFKGRNPFGGTTFLADFDLIAWQDREVRVIYDSDVMTKESPRLALERLLEHLRRKGARPRAVYLPHGDHGHKTGVDDWLAAGHTVEQLERLVEAPRLAAQPAAPEVELLDHAPERLDRPLRLVDGRAYAVTWLYARVTRKETVDKGGQVVRHDPPLVTTELRPYVVAGDGRVFGEGMREPLEKLGLELCLPEVPLRELLWTKEGVAAYMAGRHPHPVELFRRVADIPDRFIDFSRSLADQRTMAEMIGCYILSTWFLDAFTVTGFLWSNGDRGSGKTQLITVVARLAHLGQVLTAGGSFPSLRDLADYGATLAFDDAENLADPRRTDPDKRALMLAGNRRGTRIPLKELRPDKTWGTRHVNAYCPRLFSAIRSPDAVLADRTIVVPLVRTPDRYRSNTDPEDPDAWPHPRPALLQDLWAVALRHLPEMKAYEAFVNRHARLSGRRLEPWRALLAVAAWLDDKDADNTLQCSGRSPTVPPPTVLSGLHRVTRLDDGTEIEGGLFTRLEALSWAYQQERRDLEATDLTALTVQALCHCAMRARCAVKDDPSGFTVTTSEIAGAILSMAADDELDPDSVAPRRVGRVLSKMRLRQVPRPGGRGSRQWRVSHDELVRWAGAYGLPALPTSSQSASERSP